VAFGPGRQVLEIVSQDGVLTQFDPTGAHRLLRDLRTNMLLLWNRTSPSYQTVAEVRARRAHLLARIKPNLILT